MNTDNDYDYEGKCCICYKETNLYCKSCSNCWGEFSPTWYCEEHYKKVVMTGNCCRENEMAYER